MDRLQMHGAALVAAVFLLSLATFIVILDTTIINVAVPHIAGAFAASANEGTWTITSYAVAEAFTVPLSGWLVRRFGVVRTFLVSIVGFAVFSMLCGIASSLEMLVVFRVFQGLCGGPLMPASQTLIMRVTPPHRVEVAMGLWMMTTILAPIAGPILGGTLADSVGWRWAFYINIPIGILAVILISRLVVDPKYIREAVAGKLDAIGLGLLAVWLGALQIILDKGQEDDWFGAIWIRWATAVLILAFIAFLWRELKMKKPLVDLRIMLNRNFAVGCLQIAIFGAVVYGMITILPLFYQTLLGALPFGASAADFPALEQRLQDYMLKACREAKTNTSWLNPSEDYERAVAAFVSGALHSPSFVATLRRFGARIDSYGACNALSQIALKMCSPGVPDTYQGSEVWHQVLVDPDNRRPVDYGDLRARLTALEELGADRLPIARPPVPARSAGARSVRRTPACVARRHSAR